MISIFKDWLMNMLVWHEATEPYEEENGLEIDLGASDDLSLEEIEIIENSLMEDETL